MDIAQRTIRTSGKRLSVNRNPKKAVPTIPKTIGDYILLGRFEKGLNIRKTAAKLDISTSLLSAWENDICAPKPEQWKALTDLLKFPDAIMKQVNPT